jgi:hypothetical protein
MEKQDVHYDTARRHLEAAYDIQQNKTDRNRDYSAALQLQYAQVNATLEVAAAIDRQTAMLRGVYYR